MKSERKKFEATIHNPFRLEGIVERPFFHKGKVIEELADPNTGELKTFQQLSKVQTVLHDSLMYTKMFNISQEIIKTLNPSSAKVIFYMALVALKPSWDSVYLSQADVCAWCGFSPSSFRRSIDELLTKKIIARKLGSYLEFWINTNVIYNGDRVKKFKSYKQNPQANGGV